MSKFFKKLFGRNKKDKSSPSVAGTQSKPAASTTGAEGKSAPAASKEATAPTASAAVGTADAADASGEAAATPAPAGTVDTAKGATVDALGTEPKSAAGATGAVATTKDTVNPNLTEASTAASATRGGAAPAADTATGSKTGSGAAGAVAGGAAGAGLGTAAGATGATGASTDAAGPGAAAATTGTSAEKVATKTGSNPAKIAIIGHSLWGHVDELVKAASEGIKSTGATVDTYSFGETLPAEVLAKMHATAKQPYPAITPDLLKEYDGYLLAAGTRFGRLPAQVDTFFDQTGGLWATGALLGKFAGLLTSTGSQHGGQETTFVTTLPWLTHHGINYVPIGFQFAQLNETDVVQGATPWGASTLSKADGSRAVNADEKIVAEKQGAYFATVVGTFKKGASA